MGSPIPAGTPSEALITVGGARQDVRAVVLVLHGGPEVSSDPVRAYDISPLRMIPFTRSLVRAGGSHGLTVWTLRHRIRGWNGDGRDALSDARRALERIAAAHPGVPVYLLGHSMGGRTALQVADHDTVRAVVALAPWLDPGSPTEPVRGRGVLIVHGHQDRTTDPSASLAFARRARELARGMHHVGLRRAGHLMLRRLPTWHFLPTSYLLSRFVEDTGTTLDPALLARAAELHRAPDPLAVVL